MPSLTRLFDACEIKRLPKKQQTKYKEEIMTTKMDRENILYTAELRGREKGEKIGMEIGLEKGLEKGMEKGKHEALVQVAKRLLELGETIQFATEVTGLPADAFVDG
jgi:flagellar biosynthesis/type III secretory pathway protein FliH